MRRMGGPKGRGEGRVDRMSRPALPRRPRPVLRIVHEDDDVLVVDKPPGIVTANIAAASSGRARIAPARESLFDMVKAHVREGRRKRGQGRVWVIHRLDKEASGLLVFAKNEKAFEWLKADFRAKRVHRLYIAVVEGTIGEQPAGDDTATSPDRAAGGPRRHPRQLPAGTIQSFIVEGEEGELARSVGLGDVARETTASVRAPRARDRFGSAGGGRSARTGRAPDEREGESTPRLAVTHYRVMGMGQGRSLIQLRLETGRKNQIRVHMREFGRPIVGDRRYGATTDPIGRLCLHATELGFTHPTSGQTVRFSSPAPAAFYRLVGMEPPASAEQASEARAGGGGDDDARGVAPQSSIRPAVQHVETSWDSVAEWYDAMVEEEKSDHFANVIVPGALRLLRPQRGMNVLDVACGQGAIARQIAGLGCHVMGLDASPRLIEAARQRTADAGVEVRFEVADARLLVDLHESPGIAPVSMDAAICIMALMNIDPLEPVMRGIASLLKPDGVLVAVILHPAFRSPRQTSWGWDSDGEPSTGAKSSRYTGSKERGRPGATERPARAKQYRRVDGYLSPGQFPITMNPGRAAHGAETVTTWTFHRPLQAYVKALADAGFVIEALEEWPSLRQSQPGPRAAEENRARREIPMFLGLRAAKWRGPMDTQVQTR